MISNSFIEIKTKKFPIMEGEDDEVINDGMYGKALSLYISNELKSNNYDIPFYLSEDFGWWIEVKKLGFSLGIIIYSESEPGENPEKYVVTSSVTKPIKKWSWKKLRYIDYTSKITDMLDVLYEKFQSDPEVEYSKRHDEFPL